MAIGDQRGDVPSGSLLFGWKPSIRVCDGDVEARLCIDGMWEGLWNRFDELPERARNCTANCAEAEPGSLDGGGARECIPRRCFESCLGVPKRRVACGGWCLFGMTYAANGGEVPFKSMKSPSSRFIEAVYPYCSGGRCQNGGSPLYSSPSYSSYCGSRRRRSYSSWSSPSSSYYGGSRRRRSYSSYRRRRWYGRRLLSDANDDHQESAEQEDENGQLDAELFGTDLLEGCSVESFKILMLVQQDAPLAVSAEDPPTEAPKPGIIAGISAGLVCVAFNVAFGVVLLRRSRRVHRDATSGGQTDPVLPPSTESQPPHLRLPRQDVSV